MRTKLMAAAMGCALVLSAPAAHAQQFINVLTGGTSAGYYPLAVAIGKIYSDKIPNVKTQVQATKASVENLVLLQQGRGELAFTLGDSLKASSPRPCCSSTRFSTEALVACTCVL